MENYSSTPYPPFAYGSRSEDPNQPQSQYQAPWFNGFDPQNLDDSPERYDEAKLANRRSLLSTENGVSLTWLAANGQTVIRSPQQSEASCDDSMEDSENEVFRALDEEFGFDQTNNINDDDDDDDDDHNQTYKISRDTFFLDEIPGDKNIAPQALQDGRPKGRARGRRGSGRGHGHGGDRKRSLGRPGRTVRGVPRNSRGGGRGRGKRRKKDPDPGEEFKEYHGRAAAAFIENRYEEALTYAQKAADANPKVFAMHSLVAEIWEAMGNKLRSVMALTVGAYSKRDKNLWWYIADQYEEIKELSDDIRSQSRTMCMYRILEIDPDDCDARAELIRIKLDLNRFGGAMMQCRQILRRHPKDTETLRQLAYICSISGSKQVGAQKSAAVFRDCFHGFLETEQPEETVLDWSLLNIYLELLCRLDWYEEGLATLSTFSRWLLGRSDGAVWDAIDDDREWDIDDETRRIGTDGFVPKTYPKSTYGEGLPIELRAKLGIFRLHNGHRMDRSEAMLHFNLVHAINEPPNVDTLRDYSDIFRDIGDSLRETGNFFDALRFYKSLEKLPGPPNPRLLMALGDCYRALDQSYEAYECYRFVLELPSDLRTRARSYIVKLLDDRGEAEESLTQARLLARTKAGQDILKFMELTYEVPAELTETKPQPFLAAVRHTPRTSRGNRLRRSALPGLFDDTSPEARKIQSLNSTLEELLPRVYNGDEKAISKWLSIGHQMIQEFKEWENLMRIAILRKEKEDKDSKGAALYMSKLHGDSSEDFIAGSRESVTQMFTHFRGIRFEQWLDIVCQYNLILAMGGKQDCVGNLMECETYEIFSRKPGFVEKIYICRLSCGIILNNEHEICHVARWFLKQRPFATSSYRIYGVVNRLFSGNRTWYNSGPNQKFALRHLRSTDYVLLSPQQRIEYSFSIHSKSSFVLNDPVAADVKAHDPSLFAMYAHIMASGGKYVNALNYYFRAYALVPEDPILNLCIGLAYLQLALKNKAENRQLNIQQAIAYILKYEHLRTATELAIHEQEVAINLGRAWHMLGLPHLALTSYYKALHLSKKMNLSPAQPAIEQHTGMETREDFAAEAAFCLQQMLALSEDYSSAREITEQWLVIE